MCNQSDAVFSFFVSASLIGAREFLLTKCSIFMCEFKITHENRISSYNFATFMCVHVYTCTHENRIVPFLRNARNVIY